MDPRLISVLRNLYVHLKRAYNLPNAIPPEVMFVPRNEFIIHTP